MANKNPFHGNKHKEGENHCWEFPRPKAECCAGLSPLPCEHTQQGLSRSSPGVTQAWLGSWTQTHRCFLLSQNLLLVLFRINCFSTLFSLHCPNFLYSPQGRSDVSQPASPLLPHRCKGQGAVVTRVPLSPPTARVTLSAVSGHSHRLLILSAFGVWGGGANHSLSAKR